MNRFGVLGALAVWRAVVFVAVTCSPVSPPVGSPYRWLFGEGEKCEYKIEGHSTHSARTFWAGRRRAEAERSRHQAPRAAQTLRHLSGRSSDGQTAFSDRHASYGRPRGELHWARRRGARRGGGAQGGSPRCIQCPRCCEAAFGIARKSDAGRPTGSAILGGNP